MVPATPACLLPIIPAPTIASLTMNSLLRRVHDLGQGRRVQARMHWERDDLSRQPASARRVIQDHPWIGLVAGIVVHQLRVVDAVADAGAGEPGAELLTADLGIRKNAHRVLVPHVAPA